MDRLLYRKACDYDVKFYFNNPLSKISIDSDTSRICCTGFSHNAYRQMNIPCRKIVGYQTHKDNKYDSRLISYKDNELGKDFGYVASLNNQCYALLFSRDELQGNSLQLFKKYLENTEQLHFERWEKFTGLVPDQCHLYHESFILAGTLSGMIDPFYLSGISGALISGKISCYAVIHPKLAQEEFNWYSNNWKTKYKLWDLGQKYSRHPLAYKLIVVLNSTIKSVGSV